MLRPLPTSLRLANSCDMKSSSVKPRCWKTPVSRYWAKMTSSGVRADAEPTAMPSSPAETWVASGLWLAWRVDYGDCTM